MLKNISKSKFFIFVFFGFLLTVFSAEQMGNSFPETRPVAQDPDIVSWWPSRHQEVLEQIKCKNVDLIIVGDSITHRWEKQGNKIWDQYYKYRNALNLGFGGDRTQHVLWRLQNGEIDGINPKLAILMIGTNNSGRSEPDAIAAGITAIVNELKTKLPETKILLLGIFPRGSGTQRAAKPNYQDAVYNAQWAKIDKVNEMVSKLADDETVYYLNINSVFLNEKGQLPVENFPDLLHPGEKGYQLWAEAMEPMIKKLMGEE